MRATGSPRSPPRTVPDHFDDRVAGSDSGAVSAMMTRAAGEKPEPPKTPPGEPPRRDPPPVEDPPPARPPIEDPPETPPPAPPGQDQPPPPVGDPPGRGGIQMSPAS